MTTDTTTNSLPKPIQITLVTDTKVYRYPARELLGTQMMGTIGTYNQNVTPILKKNIKWVYVDFASGNDGYVDITSFAAVAGAVVASITETTIVTTDAVNVRKSPNGDILATQPEGMIGSTYSNETEVIGGHKWLYVNFLTGQDGYVATTFIQSSKKKVVATI